MEKQLEAYIHVFVLCTVSGPFNKYLFHLNKQVMLIRAGFVDDI